jgi:hypothetical protein
MPHRKYETNAERQKAYRARQDAKPKEQAVNTHRYGYKNGWIEAQPVIKILKRWCDENTDQVVKKNFRDSSTQQLSPLTQLSHWTGIKHDTLYAYFSRPKKWMEFDTADKIICHTYGPMAWRQDEELERIYQGFDFTSLDEKRPTTRAA